MKKILTILFMLVTSVVFSQATLTDLNLVFDISESNSYSSPFLVKGTVMHSTSEYNGNQILVGDLVYFQDGPATYSLPISTIVSQSYSYVELQLLDISGTIPYIPTGRAALIRTSNPDLLPVPPDGIPSDLSTGILNDLRLKIQNGVTLAEEITDYVGSAGVIPAVSAASHTGEWWRNSSGEGYRSNGTIWLPVGGSAYDTLYVDTGLLIIKGPNDSLSTDVISIAPVQSLNAGTGISITPYPGGAYTINNTGDLSNTNEIELPTQTSNNGKALYTNGTTPYWGTVASKIDTFQINGANLLISLQNDNEPAKSIAASSILSAAGGVSGTGVAGQVAVFSGANTITGPVNANNWNVPDVSRFQVVGSNTNGPVNSSLYYGVHIPLLSPWASNYGFQVAGRNTGMFYRNLQNGTWEPWYQVLSDQNINASVVGDWNVGNASRKFTLVGGSTNGPGTIAFGASFPHTVDNYNLQIAGRIRRFWARTNENGIYSPWTRIATGLPISGNIPYWGANAGVIGDTLATSNNFNITNGNLRLGLTTATARFHVAGADNLTTGYALKVQGATDNNALVVRNNGYVGVGTNAPVGYLHTKSPNSLSTPIFVAESSTTQVLRVQSDGLVGLNVFDPKEHLHIRGNILITAPLGSTSNITKISSGEINGSNRRTFIEMWQGGSGSPDNGFLIATPFENTGSAASPIYTSRNPAVAPMGIKIINGAFDVIGKSTNVASGTNFTPDLLFSVKKAGSIEFPYYPNTLNSTGSPVNILSTSSTGVLESHTASELVSAGGGISGTIATGQVAYGSGTNTITGNANITYNSGTLTVKGLNNLTTGYTAIFQNSGLLNSLVVRNDGNVGIGTSSPSEKLHVDGNGLFGTVNNAAYDHILITRSNASNNPEIKMFNSGLVDVRITAEYKDSGSGLVINKPLYVQGRINTTGEFSAVGLNSLGSAVADNQSTPGGALRLRSNTSNNQYISFVEEGVAFRGSLGFSGGDSRFKIKSGSTNLTDGTEIFSLSGTGVLRVNSLDTDLTAPTTSGSTKMVISDANGDISFTAIPSGTGTTNLAVSGTSSPLTLTSDTGTDVTFTAGTGTSLTGTSSNVTITNTGDTNAGDDLTTSTLFDGEIEGTYDNLFIKVNTVTSDHIVDGNVTMAKIANAGATSGQIISWNGTAWTPSNIGYSGTGDVTGTAASLTVSKIQGRGIATTAPTTGQVLAWTGSLWAPTTPASTGITSLNGQTGATQTFFASSTGSDFSISSSGNVHTFVLPTANSTQTGKLTSSDWNTFNAKADIGGAPAADQLAVFTNGTTISSSSALFYSASTLTVAGDISPTGKLKAGTLGTTPTVIVGRNASNEISSVTVGAGLAFNTGTGTLTATNMYLADGSLGGYRTIAFGNNSLQFNSSAATANGVEQLVYLTKSTGSNFQYPISIYDETATQKFVLKVAASDVTLRTNTEDLKLGTSTKEWSMTNAGLLKFPGLSSNPTSTANSMWFNTTTNRLMLKTNDGNVKTVATLQDDLSGTNFEFSTSQSIGGTNYGNEVTNTLTADITITLGGSLTEGREYKVFNSNDGATWDTFWTVASGYTVKLKDVGNVTSVDGLLAMNPYRLFIITRYGNTIYVSY